MQDPWNSGPTHHEVATARDGEGARAEPSTEVAKEPDGDRAWAEPSTKVATARDGEGARAEPSTKVAKEPDGDPAWAEPGTEVAEEPHGDGAGAELITTIVVVTTQSPEASEGEAHIFGDADVAKRFVERLIDNGCDRECIKTIRGDQTQLRVSLRAVVDFD